MSAKSGVARRIALLPAKLLKSVWKVILFVLGGILRMLAEAVFGYNTKRDQININRVRQHNQRQKTRVKHRQDPGQPMSYYYLNSDLRLIISDDVDVDQLRIRYGDHAA